MVEQLRPWVGPEMALSTEELARILMLAARGLKASAHTLPELQRLCQGLIQMTLATLEK